MTTRPADKLATFVEDARARVDDALERFLPRPPACPFLISKAIRHSVFAGGKRLRPILALGAADAVARRADRPPAAAMDRALPCACALEMIHTYSLIHDDLPSMDNDTLRRGRPTLHVVYGEGVAILAGDALQAEAFTLLAREPVDENPESAAARLRLMHLVAKAVGAAGMVGGQTLDLQAAGQVPGHLVTLDGDGLRGMHQLKTGALIRAAGVGGAIMAGADRSTERAIARWSEQAGLAFQIVDDILDVEGSQHHLGKTAGKDAAGAKPTYPSLFGLEESRAMAAACADRAHAVLAAAGLTAGWLGAMTDWIVTRTN